MSKFNPFNPNSVVVPNLFAGRSTQVVDICKKLSQLKNSMPASFFLFGERGIGKTALAKLIKFISMSNRDDFHSINLLTSYYSVERHQDIGSVLQESLNKLTEDMDKKLTDKIGSRLGGIFKNGKFEIGAFGVSVSVDSKNEKNREITIKDQAVSILANIIKSLNEKSDDTPEINKDGVLIIIDEMHNLDDIALASSILRNVVTTLDVDNLGKISFLLIGYEEDVEKFFSKDSSARRTFDVIKLDVMPDIEAIQVLKKGFDEAKISYDEQALSKNIEVAGGYPHSIQIIGHQLIEADTDNIINQTDWDSAIFDSVLTLQAKEFASMYSFNKPLTVSDAILDLLSRENRPMTRKEIVDSLKKNIYQYLPTLKKVGAIKENSEKKIYLQSQLFRTAILIDQFVRRRRLAEKK